MIFFYLQRPITDDLFHQLANHNAFRRSGNYIFPRVTDEEHNVKKSSRDTSIRPKIIL